MSEEQQRIVDAYFDAVNADRFADVAALFAPDAQLIAPGVRPRRGPEEIAPYFAEALSGYPVHHDDPTRVVHADATTTVEIHFTGALDNGAPLEFDAVDVFDFDDAGRIARLLTVYDSQLVRTRLAQARGGDTRTIMVTQIDHVAGEEDAFNAWYARHIEEVLAVPGVKDAQRYRAAASRAPGAAPPLREWLAVYHLAGDVQAALSEIVRRRADAEWSPRVAVVDDTISMAVFEPLTPAGEPLGGSLVPWENAKDTIVTP
jgi:ketosteroid isomerase-like protein